MVILFNQHSSSKQFDSLKILSNVKSLSTNKNEILSLEPPIRYNLPKFENIASLNVKYILK